MIGRLIDASARNRALMFFFALALAVGGWTRAAQHQARRHPRPLRPTGDRLHRVDGALAHSRRGPGHLPPGDRPPRRASRRRRARPDDVRHELRLRRLRGGHRHLLGALARAGVPQHRPQPSAARRQSRIGPDATGHRLGLPVRPRRSLRPPRPRPATCAPGLTRSGMPSPACRASRRWPPSGASSSSTRSPSTRAAAQFRAGIADVSRAVRRSNADVGGRIVEMSQREYFVRGPRLHRRGSRDLEEVVIRAGATGTPVLVRDVATVRIGRRHPPRRGGARRPGRGGLGHRRDALRGERPRRDPPRRARSWRSCGPRSRRASRWSPCTAARASSSGRSTRSSTRSSRR
jgi:hypothetical protein